MNEPARHPYRFGLLRLFALCTAIALTLTAVRYLPIPPAGQAAAGIYFSLLGCWAIMRWPAVYANLRAMRSRRRAILESRQRMLADASRRPPAAGPAGQADSER